MHQEEMKSHKTRISRGKTALMLPATKKKKRPLFMLAREAPWKEETMHGITSAHLLMRDPSKMIPREQSQSLQRLVPGIYGGRRHFWKSQSSQSRWQVRGLICKDEVGTTGVLEGWRGHGEPLRGGVSHAGCVMQGERAFHVGGGGISEQ